MPSLGLQLQGLGAAITAMLLFLVSAEGGEELGAYYEILRDMQTAQKEALRQGHVTVEVDVTLYPDTEGFPPEITARILAELSWSGESAVVRFKADDPQGYVLGREYEAMPMEDRPWE